MPRNKRPKNFISTTVTLSAEDREFLETLDYSTSVLVRAFIRLLKENVDKLPKLMKVIEEAILENGDIKETKED